ncbi:MAG: hypothetical protein AB9834_06800 [Lentimicrobium sp.]
MKKFNTWTAVLILISILLYATLALGKQNKGILIRHSGSDLNSGRQKSNMHDNSCKSDRSDNIKSNVVFNLTERLKLTDLFSGSWF